MYITRTSDLRFLSWNGKTFSSTCTLDSTELCLCFSTLAELQIKLASCASSEFLMIQATPAEFGWMAKHCDESMPVEFSEENSLLTLSFPFLKVKTPFWYLSVLLVCKGLMPWL